MSYFSSAWSTLVWNSAQAGAAIGWQRGNWEPITLRKHRVYKSKIVQELSRIAIQHAMNEINQLYPNYLKNMQKQSREITFATQMNRLQTLIDNQYIMTDEEFGVLSDSENHCFYAVDQYGTLVPEALMLSYEGEEPIESGQIYSEPLDIKSKRGTRRSNNADSATDNDEKATKLVVPNFKSKTVVHIDLAPEVSLSSKKNIVLTPVQGRDYSRKELVSGGDLQFSVSGNIQADSPGVYPKAAVQRFIMNMQYGGILNVHHFQFKQLGVTRVLITDWNLGNQEYKNIQPYSFSCVAVEPDEAIQIKDTIQAMNDVMYDQTQLSKWQRLLLNDTFARIAQNAMTGLLNSSVSQLTDLSSGHI